MNTEPDTTAADLPSLNRAADAAWTEYRRSVEARGPSHPESIAARASYHRARTVAWHAEDKEPNTMPSLSDILTDLPSYHT